MYCWSHLRSRAKCGFEKNSYLLYITQYNSRYELGLLCLESEVKINFCPSTDTTLQRLHPSSNSQLGTLIRFATSIPWRCGWWTLDWVFLRVRTLSVLIHKQGCATDIVDVVETPLHRHHIPSCLTESCCCYLPNQAVAMSSTRMEGI